MKTIYILFAVMFFSTLNLQAQYSLSGFVKSKENEKPIEYATVALLKPDSSIITGVTTNDAGYFELQNINSGSYILQFTYIGYQKVYRNVKLPSQNNLGSIILQESDNRFQEIVVTAERPFVVQRTDRYIVNIGNHIQINGRNALEVLGTTPGIFVNPEGDISVMGNDVSIYINGRSTHYSGEQLKQLLSSIQGELIDRIEVITNPSSRYDASGGSIIDIKMKKTADEGINGSIDLGYRQGKADRENLGLSVNYRNQKLNIYGNYNPTISSGWQHLVQSNVVKIENENYLFEQDATNKSLNSKFGQQYKVGLDYSINSHNTIGGFITGYHSSDAEDKILSNTTITPSLNEIVRSEAESRKSNGNDGKQANLNYQITFSKPGKQINIDLDYGQFKSTPFQYSKNKYFDAKNISEVELEQLRHTNPQKIDLWSTKIDYAQPLWKDSKIEFGGKFSHSHTDNDILYEELITDNWTIDKNQTNHFVYTEQVNAAYISFAQMIGKLNFQIGLRGEYTGSKGVQQTTNETNDSTYFNLFPSVYIDYKLSEKQQLNVNYGRRIVRPNYAQLNPFEVEIDAYSFTAGNPYLKPLIMDNFSLSYNNRIGWMMMLGFNMISNTMIEMPVQKNDRYGTIYNNFGKRETLTLMVNYRKSINKYWMTNIAIQGAYENNKSEESFGTFNTNGLAVQLQLYNAFMITPTLSAELTGLYSSAQNFAYYHVKPTSNVSIGMRKMLLNNKLSISLTANDLLYMFKTDLVAENEGMNYHIKMDKDTRWINIGIRYTFGSEKIRPTRNRTSGIEDETNRVK
jgi:hypothetical protein